MGESLKQTNIRIPEGLWKAWKIRAIEEGVTMSELLERVLSKYLEETQEKPSASVDTIHPVRRDR